MTTEQVSVKQKHEYRDWYRQKRQELIELFGGKCEECPETDPKKLQFAHKKRDEKTGRGRGSYNRLMGVFNNRRRYRLLCEICHEKYDRENGEWCGQVNGNNQTV